MVYRKPHPSCVRIDDKEQTSIFNKMVNKIKNGEKENDKMKKALVISAFPGCGKTHFYKKFGRAFNILDSDSSEFSWVKDSEGHNTKVRNPEFPQNYITHIKDNLNTAEVIFVSSHKEVREALVKAKIHFVLVYPDISLKDEWIKRFVRRGSNGDFIGFIYSKWDEFIEDLEHEEISLVNNTYEYVETRRLNTADSYIDDILTFEKTGIELKELEDACECELKCEGMEFISRRYESKAVTNCAENLKKKFDIELVNQQNKK